MFTQYADLILLISAIVQLLTMILIIALLKRVYKVENDNKNLRTENTKLYTKNVYLSTTKNKVFRAIALNAEEIECLKSQMALVNRWLGEVLNISNLIPNKEQGIEMSDIIEEWRQRIKWSEEINQDLDDDDFYQGD